MIGFKIYDDDKVTGDDFIGANYISFHSLLEGMREQCSIKGVK